MRRIAALMTALTAALWIALPQSASGSAGASFGAPVKVTPDLAGGYEPAVYLDRFGNVFATAHKENWQLALAPDTRSPTFTRSMSWDWYSSDGGTTFHDLPGLTPASLEQHDFGDEGDMATDDAGHLYFVDTNVADVTFTRWSVSGPGKISLDFHRPLLPAGEPVDDRPWVTAHGNGHVFYLGNEGDKVTYPFGHGKGSGFGPGRYTVYQSYDGGQTFDTQGYTLADSGWCRPAADHRPGSPYVYVFCTNDGGSDDFSTPVGRVGTLWAYVSADDGRTFSRYKAGSYHALDSTTSWPTVSVAPDGSIWALYVDGPKLKQSGDPVVNRLDLYHSTDHGKTWSMQDITPVPGRYEYGWLSVSPDGRYLGLGIYYRPDNHSDWHVYSAVWQPGQMPRLVSLDPKVPVQDAHCVEANGDLMGSAFGPDDRLSVVWTVNTIPSTCGTATLRQIWYARSL